MNQTHDVVRLLADGRFHSGAELGARLGIGRSAVWKHMRRIEAWGLQVHAVRGRGYRLSAPLDLLEPTRIQADMTPGARALLRSLEVHSELASTNLFLRSTDNSAGAQSGRVCLAERQTQGRGRRGRAWVSPFAANIYLSVAWRFSGSAAALGGLSLAVGVAVARAVAKLGAAEVGLKWPNDLVYQSRKLGGILLELFGEAGGPCDVVAGVGLNVAMPEHGAQLVDQPWIDLQSILGSRCPGRNRVAAALLNEVLQSLARYEQDGFSPFLADWRLRDIAAGKDIHLQLPAQRISGTALGVDDTGALLIRAGVETLRFASGEISLRLAS